MRLGCQLPVLGALITLAACGTSAGVHTSRADPLGQAPVSSDAPDNTDPTSGTSPTTGTLDWHPGDDPTVPDPLLECATLQVPLDYDNPTGESIDMAMIRVPARGERQGGSAVQPRRARALSAFDYVAAGGTTYTQALGTQAFDFIGFDPRGVERSSGIRCVSDEFMDEHLYIDDTPDTPDEQALLDELTRRFRRRMQGKVRRHAAVLFDRQHGPRTWKRSESRSVMSSSRFSGSPTARTSAQHTLRYSPIESGQWCSTPSSRPTATPLSRATRRS